MAARRQLILLGVAAAIVFVAHAAALSPTLEDVDSINFAMGVESFDVPAHQPHPPGYPVYIALAKASTALVGVLVPSWDRDRRAAGGLAFWGLIAAPLAVFVLHAFWRNAGLAPLPALLAAFATTATPLFWFTITRPLTDGPALVAALAVQAALLRGFATRNATAALPRRWIVAAFFAGLLIGLRSQTMWLTGPLLGFIAIDRLRRRGWCDAATLAGVAALGSLAWAVPLLIDSGGPSRYFEVLVQQGSEDVEGVPMLALQPTWSRLTEAARHTFVAPWTTRGLAQVVNGLAVIGLIWMAVKRRTTLALVGLAYGPYLIFHLAVQDTVITRYSLPLLVPVVGLAIAALAPLHTVAAIAGAAAMAIASLVVVQPPLVRYAHDGAPVFRAFQDMLRARQLAPQPPALRMHHQVWWGVRRALDWYRPIWDTGPQRFPGDREWLDVVKHWTSGTTQPIWFLGDLRRSDLRLFDPRAVRRAGLYEIDDEVRELMGGTRLEELTWTVLMPPRWMLGTGWALTPEIAGVAASDRMFPHQKPAEAYLRRDPAPQRVLIGGRFLSGGGPATVSVELDAVRLDEWTIGSDPNWFVRWIDLPAGVPAGDGPYAPMRVRVVPANRAAGEVIAGLEQFDAAPVDSLNVLWAYGEGWNEPEGNPQTGRLWRWTTEVSTLDIRAAPGDLKIVLSGESPLRTYDAPVEVVVRASGHDVARFTPTDDFTRTIHVPAAQASSGQVTIHSGRTFVPGDRDGGPDRRRLGVRIYEVRITR